MRTISREARLTRPSETKRYTVYDRRYSPILLATVSAKAANMNTKEIREYKKTLTLTKKQRAIIVGLLLGDGHLETQNNGRTFRLKVEHGMEQEDYVQWLFQEFKAWIPAKQPYVKIRRNGQKSIGFSTYSHGSLRFYKCFYYSSDNTKRIPTIIGKLLEPLSIAIWFMDDGSRKSLKHTTYNMHTLGFKRKDLLKLQEVLQKRFNIETNLHKQREKYWRMYIPTESAQQFTELVEKYVMPIHSMRHKLVTKMPKK